MPITEKQLNFICPSLRNERLKSIVDQINTVTPFYKMDNPDILEEFIPNILVECGEFTRFVEGMNYQSVALMKLFSRKRISMAQCINYGRTATHAADQKKIANTIYGGEWGRINLGNTEPNDGWDFKGSGPIQGTGRGLITQFTNYLNKLLGTTYTPLHVAELMRDPINLKVGLHFACWFFSIAKGLIPMAIADQFKPIVKKINGGYNGIAEREKFYERAKIVFAS